MTPLFILLEIIDSMDMNFTVFTIVNIHCVISNPVGSSFTRRTLHGMFPNSIDQIRRSSVLQKAGRVC